MHQGFMKILFVFEVNTDAGNLTNHYRSPCGQELKPQSWLIHNLFFFHKILLIDEHHNVLKPVIISVFVNAVPVYNPV